MSPILTASNVGRAAGGKTILDDVSFSIHAGEFVALTGRSGAGKSTLLAVVSTLEKDFSGEVVLFGERLRVISDTARANVRQQRLGFVLQIPRLLAGLSVWENLTAPAWVAGQKPDNPRAHMLLERVGLSPFAGRAVLGLSGGERQRLTLARALLLRPQLLFCDEPTGNLDTETAAPILELLGELQQEEQLALLVATHDPALFQKASSHLVLNGGRLGG